VARVRPLRGEQTRIYCNSALRLIIRRSPLDAPEIASYKCACSNSACSKQKRDEWDNGNTACSQCHPNVPMPCTTQSQRLNGDTKRVRRSGAAHRCVLFIPMSCSAVKDCPSAYIFSTRLCTQDRTWTSKPHHTLHFDFVGYLAASSTYFVPSTFVLTASIGWNSQDGTCFSAVSSMKVMWSTPVEIASIHLR